MAFNTLPVRPKDTVHPTESDAIDLPLEPIMETNHLTSVPQNLTTETTPTTAYTTTSPMADDTPMEGTDMAGPTQLDEVTPTVPVTITQDLDLVDEDHPEEEILYGISHEDDDSPFEDLREIVDHEYVDGLLHFQVNWSTGDLLFVSFAHMQVDFPYETARYIQSNKIGTSIGVYTSGKYQQWARSYLRQSNQVMRRMICLSALPITNHEITSFMRRVSADMSRTSRLSAILWRSPVTPTSGAGRKKRKTKPGRTRRPMTTKYGVTIPNNVHDAFELDKDNGDTAWADAIHKEISTLIKMGCFEFKSPDFKPDPEYQYTQLRMIFEVKPCGRKKARFVAGGHVVDSSGISTRSTVVKGISSRLIDLIAHRDGLETLCGDVGNAFITAPCLEKVYSRAGLEFGERSECVLIIKKALYGLASSSRAFCGYFADFLRTLGFTPTLYDRDVWMRLCDESDGYDYLCTHVDDFKVVAQQPQQWVDAIASKFSLKNSGPPDYYLGNNYQWSLSEKAWLLGSQTYIAECIRRIESSLPDDVYLHPKYTPLPPEVHPELDDSEPLDDTGIKQFQTLIGMAQWAVTIGRLDVAFAVSSLSRFSARPRQFHIELALHLFGYLKRFPNKRILMESRPLNRPEELHEHHTTMIFG